MLNEREIYEIIKHHTWEELGVLMQIPSQVAKDITEDIVRNIQRKGEIK